MKHKVSLSWLLVLMIVGFNNKQLLAQQQKSLTLKEAIDLSLQNSKMLKVSKARIEEATANLQQAVERKLPEAGVTGSYLRLNHPNIDVKAKSGNNSGGTATPQQNTANPSSAVYGILNASLPIYSGLRIRYGIESSKYLQEAASLDADNDREAVVLNTINAFDNLYKSKAALTLVTENLGGARQRLKDLSNLERNGLLARNDLLKAQLQQSTIELSLLDAENNWKLANINMNLMLGLPDNTDLIISQTYLQPTISDLKTVEEYIQLSTQNRKDIAAIGFRKKAANTATKSAKGELYPSIALTGGYIAANIPTVFNVTNAINVGVGVQYSLSSFWKNSHIEQARAREKQVEASEEILQDNIRLQVNQAYQNFLLSQKKIEVYRTAVTQAEENLRIVKNKFQNQLANTTDLLDADIAQLQAKLNAAFATADASVAYSKLLQTAGLLLNIAEIK